MAKVDLYAIEQVNHFESDDKEYVLQPEFGRWMVESKGDNFTHLVIPKRPFSCTEMPDVEKNIEKLYKFLSNEIGTDNILSISAYPMLGVGDYYTFSSEPEDESTVKTLEMNPYSESIIAKDVLINPHPRFGTLTCNIRKRRGSKVCIKIPIYKDEKTDMTSSSDKEPFPGYIYMDCMAFGMGSCCFQMTMGCCTLENTTYMYDQYIPFTPLLVSVYNNLDCPYRFCSYI
jgi:glutamate--cysteine ligase catalytic subunit